MGLRKALSFEGASLVSATRPSGSSEVLSHTVIQSSTDYTAEEAQRRRWELEDDN